MRALRLEPLRLKLTVTRYSARPEFPKKVVLDVLVAEGTDSVGALGACLEATWIKSGGQEKQIKWDDMIGDVGITVGDDLIQTDEQVKGWIRRAVCGVWKGKLKG